MVNQKPKQSKHVIITIDISYLLRTEHGGIRS